MISLTNSQGQIVNTYTYDPWGKLLTENETVENPFRYQGSVYDSETGLYYLMARYYDPNTCRFLSREGVDLSKMANPLGLNQYVYCIDNPVYLSDTDGKDPDWVQQRDRRRQRALNKILRLWNKYGSRSLGRKDYQASLGELVYYTYAESWNILPVTLQGKQNLKKIKRDIQNLETAQAASLFGDVIEVAVSPYIGWAISAAGNIYTIAKGKSSGDKKRAFIGLVPYVGVLSDAVSGIKFMLERDEMVWHGLYQMRYGVSL